jgi:hypothetical protein
MSGAVGEGNGRGIKQSGCAAEGGSSLAMDVVPYRQRVLRTDLVFLRSLTRLSPFWLLRYKRNN